MRNQLAKFRSLAFALFTFQMISCATKSSQEVELQSIDPDPCGTPVTSVRLGQQAQFVVSFPGGIADWKRVGQIYHGDSTSPGPFGPGSNPLAMLEYGGSAGSDNRITVTFAYTIRLDIADEAIRVAKQYPGTVTELVQFIGLTGEKASCEFTTKLSP